MFVPRNRRCPVGSLWLQVKHSADIYCQNFLHELSLTTQSSNIALRALDTYMRLGFRSFLNQLFSEIRTTLLSALM